MIKSGKEHPVPPAWLELTLGLDKEVAFGDNGFGQLFHCVEVLRAISADQIHFAERSPANHLDKLEVIQTDLLIRPEQIFTSFITLAGIFTILGSHIVVHFIDRLGQDLRVIFVLVCDDSTATFPTTASRIYKQIHMKRSYADAYF